MVEAITEAVRVKARPFFGICVGMQLLASRGKEHVITEGLELDRRRRREDHAARREPEDPAHGLEHARRAAGASGAEQAAAGAEGQHAYFVHSYHLNAANEADVLARADYGGPVTAIVAKDTAIGTQFHPEKSQRFGLALISNFLRVETVILFPAIDLKNGQCVRLEQGDMARATVFNLDPARAGARLCRRRALNISTSSISTAPLPASR